MNGKIVRLLVAVMAISSGGIAAALAHAHLQKAAPPAGAVVSTPPAEVRLWFTQKLEPAFSWLLALRLVTSVVTGATQAEHLEQNVKAGNWQLTAEDIAEIDRMSGV